MIFRQDLYHLLIGQSKTSYPEETGGLLLGNVVNDKLDVKKVIPLSNIRKDSRHNRIEINPLDYAKAEKLAISLQLGVWGFYHSHPDADAVPSDYDRTHFPFTEWWYPIVSIRKGEFADIRCWQLDPSRESFSEITIKVLS